MRQKHAYTSLFTVFALTMMVLPFIVSFNEALTKLAEKFILYVWVQKLIVPLETRLVGVLVMPFNVTYKAYNNGMVVNGLPMYMTWNCLGWQSLLLLTVSLTAGLRGPYSFWSKVETALLGILGIFWVNMTRITFTVLLAAFAPPVFRIVFHDYLAAFTSLIFLIAFWWFAYSFVLQTNGNDK